MRVLPRKVKRKVHNATIVNVKATKRKEERETNEGNHTRFSNSRPEKQRNTSHKMVSRRDHKSSL